MRTERQRALKVERLRRRQPEILIEVEHEEKVEERRGHAVAKVHQDLKRHEGRAVDRALLAVPAAEISARAEHAAARAQEAREASAAGALHGWLCWQQGGSLSGAL